MNIHWSSHTPNEQLYGDLPRVADKIAARRLRLDGHCFRHPELSTQKLLLWEPTQGTRGRGRPQTTYVDVLKRDTGVLKRDTGVTNTSELAILMGDKDVWRTLVRSRQKPP